MIHQDRIQQLLEELKEIRGELKSSQESHRVEVDRMRDTVREQIEAVHREARAADEHHKLELDQLRRTAVTHADCGIISSSELACGSCSLICPVHYSSNDTQSEEEAMKLASLRDSMERRLRETQAEHRNIVDTLASEKVDLASEKLGLDIQVKDMQTEREVRYEVMLWSIR